MKKSILVLVLSLFVFSTFAENFDESKKNEMQFKVGYFPYVESVVLALSTINNNQEERKDYMLPSITFEYLRYVTPKIGLGGSFSAGMPYLIKSSDTMIAAYFALQGDFRFIYMDEGSVKLYGELGAGGELLLNTKANDFVAPLFSAHISPLGVWFGSEKFFGTVELTFGTEGSFATLGCGWRF